MWWNRKADIYPHFVKSAKQPGSFSQLFTVNSKILHFTIWVKSFSPLEPHLKKYLFQAIIFFHMETEKNKGNGFDKWAIKSGLGNNITFT